MLQRVPVKKSISPRAEKTITSQVSLASDLTLLKSAVLKAGLATTLDGAGPYTVFAPTDDAFTASGVTSTVISSLSPNQIKAILLYHTWGSKVMEADVPTGLKQK